ncbi:uncharacterized protein C8A04DRAFT_30193 [Dichotomopilus funicola]|uniref:Uncharacterized protein n=1 Tax=Dichotomopilus funicola TaxID=1934379 RepID=A0AAN6V0F6_9PEZI|nr:hypothetical protein C8A04DRAFT_30193 [Dichotomopilus funicola]
MRAFVLVLSSLLAVAYAELPKANEYTSTDCSGDLNFGHHSDTLTDVTMDDTSHSVFMAGGEWAGYSQKGSGGCSGEMLGTMEGGCNNLDTGKAQRVQCVKHNPFS